MKKRILLILSLFMALQLCTAPLASAQVLGPSEEDICAALEAEGFANLSASVEKDMVVVALECDSYKIVAEGLRAARSIILELLGPYPRPVKIIVLNLNVPVLTVHYNPDTGYSRVSRSLDESWDRVRGKERRASSQFKSDINIYPQVSLMNLIITQVYQSLWQLSPAYEVSLWKGMKFSYQMKLPLYNDGYGTRESKMHPGMITFSQSFRDPWNLNVTGKLTAGVFSNNRYGLALEMIYFLPDERFSFDTQLGVLGSCYWDGFRFLYDPRMYFRWNVAVNWYVPRYDTQVTLRFQRFLLGDIGLKFEMIRHFEHCSVGLYAVKSKAVDFNAGFRFQIALPPYRHERRGYNPRVTLSPNMGMSYNAGNEQIYYKEFRTEASDNIMSKNAFNPAYIEDRLNN